MITFTCIYPVCLQDRVHVPLHISFKSLFKCFDLVNRETIINHMALTVYMKQETDAVEVVSGSPLPGVKVIMIDSRMLPALEEES